LDTLSICSQQTIERSKRALTLVRRPNEKGHTDGLVKFARRNFMAPVAGFDDFEEFNRKLAADRRKNLQRKQRVSGNL
jgi:transposase